MGDKAPTPAHSPQLHYEDKLHEVDHFQEIIGFKQPHGFQNLGEAQQHDVPSQPAEGERPVGTCHAAARARPRRLSGGRGAMPAAPLKRGWRRAARRSQQGGRSPPPPLPGAGHIHRPQRAAAGQGLPAVRLLHGGTEGGSSCRERLRALRRSGAARLPCAGSTASPAGRAAGREQGERHGNRGSGTGTGAAAREPGTGST